MENRECGTQERELNLADMILAVLLKWRVMLVTAVLLAILASGYSYYSSAKQIQAQKEQETKEIVLEPSVHLEALRYLDYKKVYENQILYNTNSPLMQLDANGYYEARVQYYVNVLGENVEATQNAMVLAYQNALQANTLFDKSMKEVLGEGVDESYYVEIIDCTGDFEKSIYGSGSSNMNEDENGVVEVTIRLNQKEQCEQLTELVCKELENAVSKVVSTLGSHTLVKVSSNVTLKASEEIIAYQQKCMDKLSTYSTAMTALEKELTAEEVAYVNQELKKSTEKQDDEKSANVQSKEVAISPAVSKRMLVVGFVAGGFLAALAVAFLYLLNGCVRQEDDFTKLYGVKVLGNIKANDNKKKKWFSFIDNAILRIRHADIQVLNLEEAVPMIVTNIKILCRKEAKNEVTITRSGKSEAEKQVMKSVSEKLAKEGIKAVVGESVLYDCASLENAANTSMIVLVESAGKVGYMSVQKEIEVCRQQGTKVVGAIIVSE